MVQDSALARNINFFYPDESTVRMSFDEVTTADEVAQVLESHGATRLVLPGFGHRVQDHPDATAAFRQFWELHSGG